MAEKPKKPAGPAKKTCFVITPIGAPGSAARKHADFVFHNAVEPACAAAGFEVPNRADKIFNTPMITAAIFNGIESADICIADLTFLNPNVFYELGIRHAIERPVIHIAQEDTPLPFDNGQHFTHFFNAGDYHSLEGLRVYLEQQFAVIGGDKYELSNPLTQARGRKALANSADGLDRVIASALERLDRLEQVAFPTRRAVPISYRESTAVSADSLRKVMGDWSALTQNIDAAAQAGGYSDPISRDPQIANLENMIVGVIASASSKESVESFAEMTVPMIRKLSDSQRAELYTRLAPYAGGPDFVASIASRF